MTKRSETAILPASLNAAGEVDPYSWSTREQFDSIRQLWAHADERLDRERLARAADRRRLANENAWLQAQLHEARVDAHQAHVELHEVRVELHEVRVELHEVRVELHEVRVEIAALRQSTSWRLTAPLRSIVGRIRGY